MKQRCLTILVLISILGVSGAVLAQAPKIKNVTVRTERYPSLEVEFDIMAPSGDLITTLSSRDVVIHEGEQRNTGQLRSGAPAGGVAYLFAVDTSGSMKRLLPEVREALARFVEQLETGDRVALATFNDDVKIVRQFTDDRSDIVTALRALRTAGKTTELYFGVFRGLEQFEIAGLPERKVAVVISDGKDEGTAYTLDDCINKANELGVNVVGLGIASGDSGALLNVQRMAEMTGGPFLRFESGQDWSAKLDVVRRHVNSRWVLSWQTTYPGDGATHPARLELALENMRIDYDLQLDLPVVHDPEAARKRLYVIIGAAVGAVVVLALFIFLLMGRKKKKAAEEERKADEERQRQADQQSILDRRLQEIGSKVEELGTVPEPRQPPVVPAAVRSKRKTMFVSGNQPVASSYTSGALEVLEGPLAASWLQLLPAQTTLGREDDNNIVLDEDRVSRHHAVIIHEGGVFWLQDLGSANGTFVDERTRVEGRQVLIHGQRIRIGGVLFRFHGEA